MYPYVSKPNQDINISIPKELIQDLLTPSESRMLKQRFQIIHLLHQGLSIRAIASRVNVGTDTVVRTARKLEESVNIKNYLKGSKQLPSSKWIFGKMDLEEKRD